MVSKKSFTLLVESAMTPFFAVVPIISDGEFFFPYTVGSILNGRKYHLLMVGIIFDGRKYFARLMVGRIFCFVSKTIHNKYGSKVTKQAFFTLVLLFFVSKKKKLNIYRKRGIPRLAVFPDCRSFPRNLLDKIRCIVLGLSDELLLTMEIKNLVMVKTKIVLLYDLRDC